MKLEIEFLPQSSEAFRNLLPNLCTEPEGAVAACVLALRILSNNRLEGEEALVAMSSELSRSTIQLAVRQLSSKPYIMHSYFSGTSPDNGYVLPQNLAIELTTNRYSGERETGKIKFFVTCSGSDSPRPVTVRKRHDGTWYADEFSSLLLGIRPPES